MNEPGRRRATVVALAVVAGVLAAVTGLLAVLYTTQRADTGRVAEQVTAAERSRDIVESRLGSLRSTLDDLRTEQDALGRTTKTLHACADPARDSVAAARSGDEAALDAALDDVMANCGR